jgi:hypothetical protein
VLVRACLAEWMWMKADEDRRLLLRHVRLDADGQPREPLDDLRAPAGFLELFFRYRAHFDRSGQGASRPPH